MKYRIVKGNIINAVADGIVLPSNTKLLEGSGTSRAIYEAAGKKKLTKACKEYGKCELGATVPTLAYDLSNHINLIFHTAVPKWVDGNSGEYDYLSSCYNYTMELADEMECKSIAFPLLASGNNGYDFDFAFEVAIKSIEAYEKKKALEEVILVLYDMNAMNKAKEKGYSVGILPIIMDKFDAQLEKNVKKAQNREEMKHIAVDYGKMALKAGAEYMADPANRKRAIEVGKGIVDIIEKALVNSKRRKD